MQKEVQNMNYEELLKLVEGKKLPCGGINNEGEMVIIEHEKNDGDSRFHLLPYRTTAGLGTITSTKTELARSFSRSEEVR